MPSGPGELSLIAGGDVGPVQQPVDRLAELVLPTLRDADFRLAQCERTYTDKGAHVGWQYGPKGTWSRLPEEYASVFFAADVDVVNMASNHTADFGWEALLDTKALFKRRGMQVIGVGANEAEARMPAILGKDGVTLAVLGYCSILRDGQAAGPEHPGLAPMRAATWYLAAEPQPGTPPTIKTEPLDSDLEALVLDVQKAKVDNNAVVIFIHWGIHKMEKTLADYQRAVAHAAIDAGADVILGHHAHMLKAVEVYKGKVCCYSIGNFMTTGSMAKSGEAAWNLYWEDKDPTSLYGMPEQQKKMALAKVLVDEGGVKRVSLIPGYINDLAQPEPLRREDPRFDDVTAYLEWTSSEVPHAFRIDGDEIVVDVDRVASG